MINGYRDSSNIILDMKETKFHQKQTKKNRWKGYDIKIIKESNFEADFLHEVLAKKHQKRENRLNRFYND